MSESCPLWRPDCQVRGAWGAANDVATGVNAAYNVGRAGFDGIAEVTGAANDLASPIGGIAGALPIVLLILLVWFVWKSFAVGTRTLKVAGPAVVKGYTGVDITQLKQNPRKSGERYGRNMRVRRESRRGIRTGIHTGQTTEIVDRSNDQHGKPTRIVVCASSSIEAENALRARLVGHAWRYTGSRPCDLNKAVQHHTYATKGRKP